MIFPLEDHEAWATRYSLEIKTIDCVKCGVSQCTTIPFAEGEQRGLIAPLHDCGPGYQLRTYIEPKQRHIWKKLFRDLAARLRPQD